MGHSGGGEEEMVNAAGSAGRAERLVGAQYVSRREGTIDEQDKGLSGPMTRESSVLGSANEMMWWVYSLWSFLYQGVNAPET